MNNNEQLKKFGAFLYDSRGWVLGFIEGANVYVLYLVLKNITGLNTDMAMQASVGLGLIENGLVFLAQRYWHYGPRSGDDKPVNTWWG